MMGPLGFDCSSWGVEQGLTRVWLWLSLWGRAFGGILGHPSVCQKMSMELLLGLQCN